MNKKIAIVTAPNMRFVNTGMTTVELAARAVFGSITPDTAVNFYSIVPPNPPGDRRWMMMDLGHVHRSATGIEDLFQHRPMFNNCDEVFASDLIVYWGDFLQARHYVEHEAAERLAAIYQLPADEAVAFAYHALLQADVRAEIGKKSVIFGSSLLYNRVNDYLTGRYAQSLQELLRVSKLSAFRDPISAHRAAHLTSDYSTGYLGVDPAFFLQDADILNLPAGAWSAKLPHQASIGLFFGTRTELPSRLFPFCEAMASSFNCSLEWLPWFPFHEILRQRPKPARSFFSRSAENDLLARIEKLLPRGDDYAQGDLLQSLGKYRFIITDTYHLCINAWRAGTPAICFGSERESGNQVIQDFKKKVLYEMFDAGDYYFDTSILSSSVGEKAMVTRMTRLLQDKSQADAVRSRMAAHTQAARQRLVRAAQESLA